MSTLLPFILAFLLPLGARAGCPPEERQTGLLAWASRGLSQLTGRVEAVADPMSDPLAFHKLLKARGGSKGLAKAAIPEAIPTLETMLGHVREDLPHILQNIQDSLPNATTAQKRELAEWASKMETRIGQATKGRPPTLEEFQELSLDYSYLMSMKAENGLLFDNMEGDPLGSLMHFRKTPLEDMRTASQNDLILLPHVGDLAPVDFNRALEGRIYYLGLNRNPMPLDHEGLKPPYRFFEHDIIHATFARNHLWQSLGDLEEDAQEFQSINRQIAAVQDPKRRKAYETLFFIYHHEVFKLRELKQRFNRQGLAWLMEFTEHTDHQNLKALVKAHKNTEKQWDDFFIGKTIRDQLKYNGVVVDEQELKQLAHEFLYFLAEDPGP